jgi:hypothetical protein
MLQRSVATLAGLSLGNYLSVSSLHAQESVAGLDEITPEIDIITETDAYVQAALSEASSLGSDFQAFATRFNQGRDIFIAAQQNLSDLDYNVTISGSGLDIPIDLTTPPVTVAEFIEFEIINLQSGQQSGLEAPALGQLERKLLAKILAGLGIKEAYNAFAELLENDLKYLGKAVDKKNWKRVAKLLELILRKILSKPFFIKLANKIGVAKATKIIAKIGAKFVPYVGWAILIAQLIWAFAEELL